MSNPDQGSLVNEAMMRALMRKEALLEKAKKEAGNALNAHHKKIKTYGVKVKNFRAIYGQIAASDDGDEFLQDLREQRRIAQLMKLPVGHQFNLIDEFDAAPKIDAELGDRAYRNGLRAHLDGADESDNPHAANTHEGQEWMRGWRLSHQLCGDGDRELAAFDENLPGPDEAANGTLPSNPTQKKRGRPKKQKPDETATVQ